MIGDAKTKGDTSVGYGNSPLECAIELLYTDRGAEAAFAVLDIDDLLANLSVIAQIYLSRGMNTRVNGGETVVITVYRPVFIGAEIGFRSAELGRRRREEIEIPVSENLESCAFVR